MPASAAWRHPPNRCLRGIANEVVLYAFGWFIPRPMREPLGQYCILDARPLLLRSMHLGVMMRSSAARARARNTVLASHSACSGCAHLTLLLTVCTVLRGMPSSKRECHSQASHDYSLQTMRRYAVTRTGGGVSFCAQHVMAFSSSDPKWLQRGDLTKPTTLQFLITCNHPTLMLSMSSMSCAKCS